MAAPHKFSFGVTKFLGLSALIVLLAVTSVGCQDQDVSREDKSSTPEEAPTESDQPRGIGMEESEELLEAVGSLSNLESILYQHNLHAYHDQGEHGQSLKVAILDNGFLGAKQALGSSLPPDTTIVEGEGNPMAPSIHGTKLAEIVYAMATGSTRYQANTPGPKLYLYNTNGYSNLVSAIDHLVKEKVDVVLYAQVWEYGGNFDGKGFINKKIDQAISSGVLWVNASGNQGQSSWSGPLEIDSTRQASLPFKRYPSSKQSFLRFNVPADQTNVKIVLAWNDFTDFSDYKTPQDLDLFLYDDKNQIIGASTLVQTGLIAPELEPGQKPSSHAREIIRGDLSAGVYKLGVVAKSFNFDKKSRLRITINGEGVRIPDHKEERAQLNTLLIPAENPGVLAVSATDVDFSNTSGAASVAQLPEISLRSEVRFGSDFVRKGTSSAAAIAAGALTVYLGKNGKKSQAQIKNLIVEGKLSKDLRLP